MSLPSLPAISGMVKVAANQFLVVHDTKGLVGPWLGVVDVQENGATYREVVINKWPPGEAIPNDLEGICAIPEQPGQFLLVESGYYQGQFGRVIKVQYPTKARLAADYLGSFQPFSAPAKDFSTPRHEEIEGIAVVRYQNITALLLAQRGGRDEQSGAIIAGQLIWGEVNHLDTSNPQFTRKPNSAPLSDRAIADRGAADLYVTSRSPNSWDIYAVATSDGGNLGPFRSAVYLAGMVSIEPPAISFVPETSDEIVHWNFAGLKVEAVAAPAELLDDASGISVATDDENYGGLWRPIQRTIERRSPSPLLFAEYAKKGFSLK